MYQVTAPQPVCNAMCVCHSVWFLYIAIDAVCMHVLSVSTLAYILYSCTVAGMHNNYYARNITVLISMVLQIP